MTVVLKPRLTAGRSLTRIVVIAGATAAVVEMMPILTIQGAALGVSPIRIFQSIASGLLGHDAYADGLSAALLGAALHLLISLVAALFFVVAADRRPVLTRHPVLSSVGFGVISFVVMSWIVVPLSAAAFKPNFNPALMAMSLAIHALFFGLPIALVTRWLSRSGTDL